MRPPDPRPCYVAAAGQTCRRRGRAQAGNPVEPLCILDFSFQGLPLSRWSLSLASALDRVARVGGYVDVTCR